jgi:hypothetical protein
MQSSRNFAPEARLLLPLDKELAHEQRCCLMQTSMGNVPQLGTEEAIRVALPVTNMVQQASSWLQSPFGAIPTASRLMPVAEDNHSTTDKVALSGFLQ